MAEVRVRIPVKPEPHFSVPSSVSESVTVLVSTLPRKSTSTVLDSQGCPVKERATASAEEEYTLSCACASCFNPVSNNIHILGIEIKRLTLLFGLGIIVGYLHTTINSMLAAQQNSTSWASQETDTILTCHNSSMPTNIDHYEHIPPTNYRSNMGIRYLTTTSLGAVSLKYIHHLPLTSRRLFWRNTHNL